MPPSKSKAPKTKLPKGRVMFIRSHESLRPCYTEAWLYLRSSNGRLKEPVLVLLCANLQAARARLRWERLSESEKIEALRELLKRTWNQTHEATARAILSLQSSPAKGGREK